MKSVDQRIRDEHWRFIDWKEKAFVVAVVAVLFVIVGIGWIGAP